MSGPSLVNGPDFGTVRRRVHERHMCRGFDQTLTDQSLFDKLREISNEYEPESEVYYTPEDDFRRKRKRTYEAEWCTDARAGKNLKPTEEMQLVSSDEDQGFKSVAEPIGGQRMSIISNDCTPKPGKKRRREVLGDEHPVVTKRQKINQALCKIHCSQLIKHERRWASQIAPRRMRTRSMRPEPIMIHEKRGHVAVWRHYLCEYIVTSYTDYEKHYVSFFILPKTQEIE